jgi:hypothetical protein
MRASRCSVTAISGMAGIGVPVAHVSKKGAIPITG